MDLTCPSKLEAGGSIQAVPRIDRDSWEGSQEGQEAREPVLPLEGSCLEQGSSSSLFLSLLRWKSHLAHFAKTELLTQGQRTRTLRPLEAILLVTLPLHSEGETEAPRVVRACSGIHSMFVAEPELMSTYLQLLPDSARLSSMCHHPSQPALCFHCCRQASVSLWE